MSLRNLIKTHNFFVVKYDCDGKMQLRSRGFILHDGEVQVGEKYSVRWGGPKNIDVALILAEGSERDMHQMIYENKSKSTIKIDNKSDSEGGSSNYNPSSKKRKADPKPTSSKNPAKLLRVTTPNFSDTTTSTTSPHEVNATECLSPSATLQNPLEDERVHETDSTVPQQPMSPVINENPPVTNPVTAQPKSPSIFRYGRPHIGTGPMISRLNAMEESVCKLSKRADDLQKGQEKCCKAISDSMSVLHAIKKNQDVIISLLTRQSNDEQRIPLQDTSSDRNVHIPEQFEIRDDTLREIKSQSLGPGNFAAKLTKKLFPELFCSENMRMLYSWVGGGVLNKRELCATRKEVIKHYVVKFYPEFSDEGAFRERIVPKINKLLRRKDKERKRPDSKQQAKENVSSDTQVDLSLGEILTYLN